jgi:hypothetical protein
MRSRRTSLTTADQRDRCLAPAILRIRALLRGATVSLCLGFALVTLIAPHFNPVMARTTDGAPLSGATADLFKAVEVNDMPGVKAALAAGADIAVKNAAGKTPADQFSSRFTTPPAKPAPADDLPAQPAPGSDLPEIAEAPKAAPIEATEPARALTPPPLPKRAAPPKRAPHFVAPPRKPQPPLPEAVEVAKAPGGVTYRH